MSKIVSLNYLNDYNPKELESTIKNVLEQLCLTETLKPKMKVLIKACLSTDVSADMAETTHPSVIRALSNVLKGYGVECIVADSPFKKYTLEALDKVYLNTGMLDAANQSSCVLNKDLSTFTIQTPNGVMNKSLTLMNVINQVDAIINVGKLKIDETLGYMGAISNLFGFVPGEIKNQALARLATQKDFHNYCLDIHDVVKDKVIFNVLDGIVALESGKTQRMLNCLAIADNMFCLDGAIVDILDIGFKNTALKQAKARGLFDFEKGYKIIGDKLDKFKVQDFNIHEFSNCSPIYQNKAEQVKYFKKHQLRTKIKPNVCKGCGICSKICPTGAISMKTDEKGELYASINYAKCIFCNKCHTACPYQVVEMVAPIGHKRIMKDIEKQNQDA